MAPSMASNVPSTRTVPSNVVEACNVDVVAGGSIVLSPVSVSADWHQYSTALTAWW